MFIDEAQIHVKAGDGGDGCMSFRREKFVPKGGPNGGDGGRGGSVYFYADESIDTLLDFSGRPFWHATDGRAGEGSNCHGLDGQDLIVRVPPGTQLYDIDKEIMIKDMDTPGMKVLVCKGGRGGLGNQNFATSTRQAPRIATKGAKGQERNLRLELKLIADVGLVGMPNAGKSTLLSRCSAARPKIANYPFTTLSPVLGIVELSGQRRFVMADLPGLIEGASDGAGLGIEFLRHVERTRMIIHLLDVAPMDGSDPADNYRTIRNELAAYSKAIARKKELIVITKTDLDPTGTATEALRKKLPRKKVLALSAATGQGLEMLMETLWTMTRTGRKKKTTGEQI